MLVDSVKIGVVPPELVPARPLDDATVRDVTFPLNVDQSVELNAPLLLAFAVGTFKVMTGVVVLFATVELRSVPAVSNVSAATLATPLPAEPT